MVVINMVTPGLSSSRHSALCAAAAAFERFRGTLHMRRFTCIKKSGRDGGLERLEQQRLRFGMLLAVALVRGQHAL